jgi:putative hydrolase of the HAD superfamily
MPSTPFVGIRAVFLDAGGTLFQPYPSVGEIYSATALRHGLHVAPAELERFFHEAWQARNGLSSLAGATSDKIERDWWYGLVKDVFARAGTFEDFEAFFEELYDLFARPECWRLFEDSVPLLETLKRRGLRIGMISNWDQRLLSIVEGLGIRSYFDGIWASSAVGVAKPGPGIFHKALEGLQVPPEASLHVGDSVTDDYHGARSVGMHAALLDRRARAYNGLVRITSLHEVPALLA